jgi:hypothetical protein
VYPGQPQPGRFGDTGVTGPYRVRATARDRQVLGQVDQAAGDLRLIAGSPAHRQGLLEQPDTLGVVAQRGQVATQRVPGVCLFSDSAGLAGDRDGLLGVPA